MAESRASLPEVLSRGLAFADAVLAVAEHLGCPLLRADSHFIQQNRFQLIQGYSATLGQFLRDATEWGGLVLFDGT
jgi:hypothetical protein